MTSEKWNFGMLCRTYVFGKRNEAPNLGCRKAPPHTCCLDRKATGHMCTQHDPSEMRWQIFLLQHLQILRCYSQRPHWQNPTQGTKLAFYGTIFLSPQWTTATSPSTPGVLRFCEILNSPDEVTILGQIKFAGWSDYCDHFWWLTPDFSNT